MLLREKKSFPEKRTQVEPDFFPYSLEKAEALSGRHDLSGNRLISYFAYNTRLCVFFVSM